MRPAFSSTKSAAAFALLLLTLLALPAVVGKNLLPSREQSYAALSWGSGPYPWIQNQIFEETNDIDIAFVGSSHMFRGIDTPYVQAALSKQLGRPAVVRTIAWGGAGYDVLYFITQDLLAHRNVRWLVFYDEINSKQQRNVQGTSWFRFAENAGDIAGLPLMEQGRFYLVALVGMPRNLLGTIRHNLPAELFSSKPHEQEIILHAPNPATRLGSFPAQAGFNSSEISYDFTQFVPFIPTNGVGADSVCVYSPATKSSFQFSGQPLPGWQLFFARKFAALAKAHDARLMMLHLPTTHEMRSPVIQERACWPDVLNADISLIGIPPAVLSTNLTDDDVLKLYSDWGHLNKNGMEFYTQLITPALLKVYDSKTKP
jgi:hypothetical protein